MLASGFTKNLIEAGCDEAGRGCIAGPVFAAAVIMPFNFKHPQVKDSKKLSGTNRIKLRSVIEKEAVSWAVAFIDNKTIDKINILNASISAMHLAINKLQTKPQILLIDGNRFKPYKKIPYECIIQGDNKYLSIAAASILAKTYRDEYMLKLHAMYPEYGWNKNKGYPTHYHRCKINDVGISKYHRKSFKLYPQPKQQVIF